MEQSSKRKISPVTIGVGLVGAVAVAYGATYVINTSPKKAEAPAPSAPAKPAAPPTFEYLGATAVEGQPIPIPANGTGDPVKPFTDDASIVFLKVKSDGPLSRENAPQIAIKDEDGKSYTFTPERREGGLMALHLKEGYPTKPKKLELSVSIANKPAGSWTIDKVADPKVILTSAPDPSIGSVVVHPGRRGRQVAQIEFAKPTPKDEGYVLTPLAETYVKLDPSRFDKGIP